jgi:hypothetical protein
MPVNTFSNYVHVRASGHIEHEQVVKAARSYTQERN